MRAFRGYALHQGVAVTRAIFRTGRSEPNAGASDAGAPVARGQLSKGAERTLREQDLLDAIERIPSLPTVVTEILRLARVPTTSARELEDVLQTDMALAGRLLKLVNSTFYALPTKIANLGQAVGIVGIDSLRSLVLASSTSGFFAIDASVYGFVPQGLWKHSIATAGLLRRLALIQGRGRDEAEDLFVGALLRDIGMIVLAPFLTAASARFVSSVDGVIAQERAAIGFDHVWVGQRLAQRWNLPPDLTEILVHHHDAPSASGDASAQRLALVGVADAMVTRSRIGLGPSHGFSSDLPVAIVRAAGITATQLAKTIHDMPEVMALAAQELG